MACASPALTSHYATPARTHCHHRRRHHRHYHRNRFGLKLERRPMSRPRTPGRIRTAHHATMAPKNIAPRASARKPSRGGRST
eukprot:811854-Alexandrium_andersonii.AAC.1